MADELVISNDTVGYAWRDVQYTFAIASYSETSAHGVSAPAILPVVTVPRNGRIVDFGIGVVARALSASGFVSGAATASLYINGVSATSTVPVIQKATSAGQASTRVLTNAATTSTAFLVPSVINIASANCSTGDQIGYIYNLQSGGSAAATTAGTGFYGYVTIRYAAT